MKRRLIAAGLALAVAALPACTSKRKISVEDTGSVKVEGTTWYRFCDGPNGVIWIKSRTDSEPDELEAYVYDHWACAPDYYEKNPGQVQVPGRPDDDGISEDEE